MKKTKYIIIAIISFIIMSATFCISAIPDIIFREDLRALIFMIIYILIMLILPLPCIIAENSLVKKLKFSRLWYNISFFTGAVISLITSKLFLINIDINVLFPNRSEFDKMGLGLSICHFLFTSAVIYFAIVRLIYFAVSLENKKKIEVKNEDYSCKDNITEKQIN